jgi:hypothetical protein
VDTGIILPAGKALDQEVLRSAPPNGENKNTIMCKPQETHARLLGLVFN